MSGVVTLIFLALAGPGLLWAGVMSLRRGYWRDSVPLLEVVIDRAAGTEPPARTAWDQRFAYAQAWVHIIIGAAFSAFLIIVLLSFLSE